MGLGITVYTNIRKVPGGIVDEDHRCDVPDDCTLLRDQYTAFYPAEGFEVSHFGDMDAHAVYTFDDKEPWSIGAYSFYSEFRNELAKLAGWAPLPDVVLEPGTQQERHHRHGYARAVRESPTPGPLSMLVYYSDCEGTICNAVCGIIYKDLRAIEEKAYRVWGGVEDYADYLDTFTIFLAAFEMALIYDGVVVFN